VFNSHFFLQLRAHNEEGPSLWSTEVTYRTLPAPPGPPPRPSLKGRVHATSFKIRWEPPTDSGGTQVSQYLLEINSGSGYDIAYEGQALESVCDRLQPGTNYQVRVSARGPGGHSEPSEPLSVTTDPVCPGACAPPRLHGRAKPYSLTLRFSKYPNFINKELTLLHHGEALSFGIQTHKT